MYSFTLELSTPAANTPEANTPEGDDGRSSSGEFDQGDELLSLYHVYQVPTGVEGKVAGGTGDNGQQHRIARLDGSQAVDKEDLV